MCLSGFVFGKCIDEFIFAMHLQFLQFKLRLGWKEDSQETDQSLVKERIVATSPIGSC